MKKFELNAAIKGEKLVTRLGNRVEFKSVDNNNPKVCVVIYPHCGFPYITKINLDGSKYSPNNPHFEDVFMAA